MNTHIAVLRAVNVGGHAVVPMSELRLTLYFEESRYVLTVGILKSFY
jgi:uncharacterized protein (DUF1697 family)